MSRSENVGVVKKHVPSTKVLQQPGGNQTFNIFAAAAEPEVLSDTTTRRSNQPLPTSGPGAFKSSTLRIAPPGGRTSIADVFSVEKNIQEDIANRGKNLSARRPSVQAQPEAAPSTQPTQQTAAQTQPASARRAGPSNSLSNIFAPLTEEEQQAMKKNTIRVAAAPGGKSVMGEVLGGQTPREEVPRRTGPVPAALKSSIFSSEPAPEMRTSTKVIQPKDINNMNAIISNTAEPEPFRSIHTGRTNQSNNVINLTPKADKVVSARTNFKNKSHHVLNLSPEQEARQTNRTYRTNEESKEMPAPVPVARYEKTHKMLQSNIFTAPAEQPKPRPRLLPHKNTSTVNIFSS